MVTQTPNLERIQHPPSRVGDRVFLRTDHIRTNRTARKLSEKKIGPFLIISMSFTLQLPSTIRIHPVFHVSQLEPEFPNTLPISNNSSDWILANAFDDDAGKPLVKAYDDTILGQKDSREIGANGSISFASAHRRVLAAQELQSFYRKGVIITAILLALFFFHLRLYFPDTAITQVCPQLRIQHADVQKQNRLLPHVAPLWAPHPLPPIQQASSRGDTVSFALVYTQPQLTPH